MKKLCTVENKVKHKYAIMYGVDHTCYTSIIQAHDQKKGLLSRSFFFTSERNTMNMKK